CPRERLYACHTPPSDPSAAAKELLTDVRPRHSRKKATRIVHVIVARSPFDSKRGRPLATDPCYGVEQARRAERSRVGSERGESLDDLESARSVSGGRPRLAGGEPLAVATHAVAPVAGHAATLALRWRWAAGAAAKRGSGRADRARHVRRVQAPSLSLRDTGEPGTEERIGRRDSADRRDNAGICPSAPTTRLPGASTSPPSYRNKSTTGWPVSLAPSPSRRPGPPRRAAARRRSGRTRSDPPARTLPSRRRARRRGSGSRGAPRRD